MKYNTVQIKKKIGEQAILTIAKESGFEMRQPRKIDGVGFLIGFCMMMQFSLRGLSDWARAIGKFTGKHVSKQGLQKKLQFRQESFVRDLLMHVIKQSAKGKPKNIPLLDAFNKVYVEDSTCLSLPKNLAKFYPGPHSKNEGQCATARVQLRINLKDNSYQNIQVNSFRDNDQSFAHQILDVLEEGALVIRDQGYFVLSVFKKIIEKKAFFLSRLRFGTNVYDGQTGEKLDLLKLLSECKKEGKKVLDINVLLGSTDKIPVRLVAVEAPEDVKRIRRFKAKNDRNGKANHSDEYFELLGWTIFITNVEAKVWGFRDIIRAYRCRWRIEIIFKCWKSSFNVDNFFDGKESISPPRVIITIYMMLIWLTMTISWYGIFVERVYEQTQKHLSIIKFSEFIKRNFWEVLLAGKPDQFIEELARHDCYEKRKDRQSYLELLYMNFLS